MNSDKDNKHRTVTIDYNIGELDFQISNKDKQILINQGYNVVKKFLTKNSKLFNLDN